MNKIYIAIALTALLSACDVSESMREKSTQDPTVLKARELSAKYGCMGCHTVTNSVMGPAWRLVAARYRDTPGAKAVIIDAIKNGSSGRWPEVSRVEKMPNYDDSIPDEELELIADYILQLK